jgi:hypothetical protein
VQPPAAPCRAPTLDRSAALAVALPLASLPFLLPHVVEDFHWGIAERVGLPGDILAAYVGFALAAQMAGIALAVQGRPLGLAVIAATAAVWTVGGLWDHGMALVAFGLGFRGRVLSAVWAIGLIVAQGATALCALAALRTALRTRRRN